MTWQAQSTHCPGAAVVPSLVHACWMPAVSCVGHAGHLPGCSLTATRPLCRPRSCAAGMNLNPPLKTDCPRLSLDHVQYGSNAFCYWYWQISALYMGKKLHLDDSTGIEGWLGQREAA